MNQVHWESTSGKTSKTRSSDTLPIKWSEAGQPEDTAFCKLGCSLSSDNAEI